MATYDDAFGLIIECIQRQQAVWGPPAVSVAVTDRAETLWSYGSGFADVEAQTPATPRTLYQIGSVGKSFTSWLVMQAVEQGKIGLQHPVKDVLEWFDVKERIRPITVEDLLLHQSGLSTGLEGYESGLAEALTMSEFDPAFAPAAGFLYSNLGFKLAGFILERVSGKRYPDLVAEHILEPLGMVSSHPEITQALRPLTATGYRHIFTDRPAHASHPLMPSAFTSWSATADGCISSTVEDMAAYLRVFANHGAYPGGRLLSPASFERMTRGQNTDPESGDKIGFGIWTSVRFGRPILEHTGGMISHATHMSIDPESGIGLVMIGNAYSVNTVMAEYARGLLCDVADSRPLRPLPSMDVRLLADPESYRGVWRSGERTLTLTSDGGKVVAEVDGARAYLEHRSDGICLLPIPGWDLFLLRPVRDAGGRITSITHGPNTFFPQGAEGFVPLPSQELEPIIGHYRSYNPWLSDLRVFQRGGKPWLQEIDDTTDPGDRETELIPLPGQRVYSVGGGGFPDQIRFENLLYGKTQTAMYMNQAYGRLDR